MGMLYIIGSRDHRAQLAEWLAIRSASRVVPRVELVEEVALDYVLEDRIGHALPPVAIELEWPGRGIDDVEEVERFFQAVVIPQDPDALIWEPATGVVHDVGDPVCSPETLVDGECISPSGEYFMQMELVGYSPFVGGVNGGELLQVLANSAEWLMPRKYGKHEPLRSVSQQGDLDLFVDLWNSGETFFWTSVDGWRVYVLGSSNREGPCVSLVAEASRRLKEESVRVKVKEVEAAFQTLARELRTLVGRIRSVPREDCRRCGYLAPGGWWLGFDETKHYVVSLKAPYADSEMFKAFEEQGWSSTPVDSMVALSVTESRVPPAGVRARFVPHVVPARISLNLPRGS